MSGKIGLNAKLYYKEIGMDAAGDWTELSPVKDVTLNMEKAQADLSTRGNTWRAFKSGLKDATVEFELVWDPDDAGFEAIHDAFFNDNKIGLSIMDGAIATGNGLQADFEIVTFNRNEPLEEGITANVTAKPAYGTTPRWLEGGASPTGTETY